MAKTKKMFRQFSKAMNTSFISLLCIFTLFHLVVLVLFIVNYTGQKNYQSRNAADTELQQLIIHAGNTMPRADLQNALAALTQGRLRISGHNLDYVFNDASKPIPADATRIYDLSQTSQSSNNTAIKKPNANRIRGDNRSCTGFLSSFYNKQQFYYLFDNGQWLYFSMSCTSVFFTTASIFISVELITIGFIIFYLLSITRFARQLKVFKDSADRLGIDLNTRPFAEIGPSLLRETADAMNRMQIRIKNLITNRTRMLAAISHDLRTPITRLKLRAQFIENKEQSQKIIHDLTEMEIMITEILDFAKEDMHRTQKTKFDINGLLLSICHEHIDKGCALTITAHSTWVPFFGSPLAMKRTFNNLIENAIKFGHKIWVKLQLTSNQISIVFEDDGPGIPQDELDKVIKPFYRSAHTPALNNSGVGLGLTIAKEIIEEHGGHLTLENRDAGGLQVKIILPYVATPPSSQRIISTADVNI